MDPGELDKRVLLLRLAETGRDGAGAPITEEVEIARPWAKVIEQGGREFFAADGLQTEKRVVFRVWARDDLDTLTVFVRYRGVHHDIKDLRPFDDVTEIHTVARPVTT